MLLLPKKVVAPENAYRLVLLFRSLSATREASFMETYLINTCGLSPIKAATAAKRLTNIKSPQMPDSVISFLTHWGFDHSHIRRLVSNYPPVLCCHVDNPLESNIRTLLDIGFSQTQLPRVVTRNPQLLSNTNMKPRIQFRGTLLGNDDKKLRMALERNRNLFNIDAACFTSRISVFKNHGLSDQQIQKLLIIGSPITASSTDTIESVLKWTVDLGLLPDSSMFVYYLHNLAYNGKAEFEKKIELFKKYGWSDHEFRSAFKMYPMFTSHCQNNIQAKMEFLVGVVGCTPSYIALNPYLLGSSLKRLMSRNHILQILEAKEVANINLHNVIQFTDKKFVEKCIHRFEEEVPGLVKIYSDACAGNIDFIHQDRQVTE